LKNGSLGKAIEFELKLNSNWKVKVKDYGDETINAVFIFNYENEKVGFNKELKYKFAKQTCQRCERISGGYYEAIAQLRGSGERINNLIKKITKYVERREGFITKIEIVENGKDVYVSDKLIMNEFFKDYDLKPKRSFRLYGMKRGKKLFRNTYSLHL
jgi:NMD protein affecting ribosome stability and mRNA decay